MNLCIQLIIPFNDPPIAAPAEAETKLEDRKGGFPHSEITGSKGARASPVLIAACHVLHRLSTPRHPLGALIRLIVLSKTHACFAVRSTQGQGDPIRKRTHQFCISQTMMSSQVQPGQHSRARLNPSIHDVKARPAEAGVQFCHLYRESLVEPDGIEPTT